uniref:Cytochrome P450 n=1 Tax=Meloidogyne floridensis TaxID=298350 RepID=A0A915NNT1_9BILA
MEGEQWKTIRRFGLQSMRNLGVGKNELENKLIKDLENFIEKLKGELKTNITGEINLQKYIDRIVGSTINRLLFGYAFEDEQINEFYELKNIMDNELELLSSITGRMLLSMPRLRYLPVFSKTFKLLDDNIEKVFNYINRIVYERINKMKFGENEEPKDLLDYFLKQSEEAKNANWSEEKKENFDLKNLAPFSFDLFIAGQETTAKTLGFLVLYLLLDQRVQKKLHKELDNLREEKIINGFDAYFTMTDRTKLPYLNAVINETQRSANLLPINLAHRTMSDANILNKFNLKKGTPIVPQICCIFPHPYRFEPERFLDDQGMLKRVEQLIPFGIGKRICMGESLARMEIFLFASNFFSHFEVLPVDPLNPPSSEKRRGLTVAPIQYNCRLVVRNINN